MKLCKVAVKADLQRLLLYICSDFSEKILGEFTEKQ